MWRCSTIFNWRFPNDGTFRIPSEFSTNGVSARQFNSMSAPCSTTILAFGLLSYQSPEGRHPHSVDTSLAPVMSRLSNPPSKEHRRHQECSVATTISLGSLVLDDIHIPRAHGPWVTSWGCCCAGATTGTACTTAVAPALSTTWGCMIVIVCTTPICCGCITLREYSPFVEGRISALVFYITRNGADKTISVALF